MSEPIALPDDVTWGQFMRAVGVWVRSVPAFDRATTLTAARHLREEVRELGEDLVAERWPEARVEIADVLILAADIAWRNVAYPGGLLPWRPFLDAAGNALPLRGVIAASVGPPITLEEWLIPFDRRVGDLFRALQRSADRLVLAAERSLGVEPLGEVLLHGLRLAAMLPDGGDLFAAIREKFALVQTRTYDQVQPGGFVTHRKEEA